MPILIVSGTGPISAFEQLTPRTLNIVDDAGIVLDIVSSDPAATELSYCVGIEYGGFEYTANTCCTAADIAGQRTSFFNADSLDGSTVLVGGIVPDAVTEIRSDDEKSITPERNLWWDVIDGG